MPPGSPLPTPPTCRWLPQTPENSALFNGRLGLQSPVRTLPQALGQKAQKARKGRGLGDSRGTLGQVSGPAGETRPDVQPPRDLPRSPREHLGLGFMHELKQTKLAPS